MSHHNPKYSTKLYGIIDHTYTCTILITLTRIHGWRTVTQKVGEEASVSSIFKIAVTSHPINNHNGDHRQPFLMVITVNMEWKGCKKCCELSIVHNLALYVTLLVYRPFLSVIVSLFFFLFACCSSSLSSSPLRLAYIIFVAYQCLLFSTLHCSWVFQSLRRLPLLDLHSFSCAMLPM